MNMYISKCCNASTQAIPLGDGTSYYQCEVCEKACDVLGTTNTSTWRMSTTPHYSEWHKEREEKRSLYRMLKVQTFLLVVATILMILNQLLIMNYPVI